MKDETEVSKSSQNTSQIVVASSTNAMDLSELWIMLVRWKVIVISVAIVTFVIIVADAFLYNTSPVYKAKTYLSIPSENEIKGIQGTPRDKVFRIFIENLKSRNLRLRYFKENNLFDKLAANRYLDEEQVFEEKFNRSLSVVSQGDNATVSLEGANAKFTADWVNGFVTLVNKETVRQLVDYEISKQKIEQKEIEIKVDELRAHIASRRSNAKQDREDHIIKLEEMALIADRIGIKNVSYTSDIFQNPDVAPIYIRGSKALRAEASVLRERKSDDPYYNIIRKWQAEIVSLQSTSSKLKLTLSNSNYTNVATMQVMQMAITPKTPINKPQFKWVILTGLLAALVMGMLAALFADFIVRTREIEANKSGRKLEG